MRQLVILLSFDKKQTNGTLNYQLLIQQLYEQTINHVAFLGYLELSSSEKLVSVLRIIFFLAYVDENNC